MTICCGKLLATWATDWLNKHMNNTSIKSKISYRSDSKEGKTFSTEFDGNQFGWVEYCVTKGDLYVCRHLDHELETVWNKQAVTSIREAFIDTDHKHLGFVQHLCQERQREEFLLPLFATLNETQQLKLGAGRSRYTALTANGEKIHAMILLVPHGHKMLLLHSCKQLTTTAEFDEMFGLQYLDYEITLEEPTNGLPVFLRSVIRHSIYDKQDQALPHINAGVAVHNFWHKNIRNYGKIALEVHCTERVAKLIQPSELFYCNIIVEKEGEWEWNYGRLVGAYRKNDNPVKKTDLYLWLFDVNGPVNLELLMPWVQNDYTCFYSDNKKSVLFDTTDVTSMQIIGDWVN
jgi:hypothetical protein